MAPTFPEDCDPTLPGDPDPYPYFHRLRSEDPVHWSRFLGGWVLTRYSDAVAYLRDHRFSRVAYLDRIRERFGADSPLLAFQSRELSFTDPPAHTWIKNLFGKAFSPQAVARIRPAAERIVGAMLDSFANREQIDLVADLAYPIPANVIAAMLGVPEADWAHLRELVDGIVVSRGIVRTPEMIAAGERTIRAFDDYFARMIAERRRAPGADLLSQILSAEESGRRLSDAQIVAMVETLFAAGHATTRSLIATGMLALLRHPSELARLREQPHLIASAVEEMLRYDSPTQAPSPQIATEDAEIGGHIIRKGDLATVLLGAANRDPARFPDPDRFDITRKDNEHLGFSMGIHYCLGAGLARLEAQVVIGSAVARFARIRLTGAELKWQRMGRFRGLSSLPVALN